MNEIKVVYTPGVCNIGPAEIARRRMVGWIGLVITVVFLAALFYFKSSSLLRLIVVLPAFVSASGFLQAYFHFCSGFAQEGVFNLGEIGTTQKVTDAAAKAKDAKRGRNIMLYAFAMAIIFALIAAFI